MYPTDKCENEDTVEDTSSLWSGFSLTTLCSVELPRPGHLCMMNNAQEAADFSSCPGLIFQLACSHWSGRQDDSN